VEALSTGAPRAGFAEDAELARSVLQSACHIVSCVSVYRLTLVSDFLAWESIG
jgi:hypothetical protein